MSLIKMYSGRKKECTEWFKYDEVSFSGGGGGQVFPLPMTAGAYDCRCSLFSLVNQIVNQM